MFLKIIKLTFIYLRNVFKFKLKVNFFQNIRKKLDFFF